MAVPTDDDQIEAIRRLLVGVRDGDDPFELTAARGDLHIRRNTFPGEVFLQLGTVVVESLVETHTEVRVRLRAVDDTGNDVYVQPLVSLEEPLGGRTVVDDFTGNAVPERE